MKKNYRCAFVIVLLFSFGGYVAYLLCQDSWKEHISVICNVLCNVLPIIASIVTISGLISIVREIKKKKISRERQELIIKDLIRHLFINAAIMEVIRIQMSGNWGEFHPQEGVFSKFCVLDTDLQLDQIQVNDNQYTKLHSISLYLRNYNIMCEVAEKHSNDPHIDDPIIKQTEMERELDELWERTKKISKNFMELCKETDLNINETIVQDYIQKYYEEELLNLNKEKDLLKRKEELLKEGIEISSRININEFFGNKCDLKKFFESCILLKYTGVILVPLNAQEKK